MRCRLRWLYTGLIFILCFGLLLSGCKKETAKSAPWLSSNFTGTFTGSEVCTVSGMQTSSITITADSATRVGITDLYGAGKMFAGVVSGDTCIIQPQVYNNGTGNAIIQGSFTLISDTIRLSIIVSTFGQQDMCNAVLVKQ